MIAIFMHFCLDGMFNAENNVPLCSMLVMMYQSFNSIFIFNFLHDKTMLL